MIISKRNLLIISHFLKDKNKKSWIQILNEIFELYISERRLPVHYITNLLYRKNISHIKYYLNLTENEKVLEWSHSLAKSQIVLAENKLLFCQHMEKNNIKTPKIYFHNSKNNFLYKNQNLVLQSSHDFYLFLESFFDDEGVNCVFCKPTSGKQAQNIFVIKRGELNRLSKEKINYVLSNSFIFQEKIDQNKYLNQINNSCVNTLRIVSYRPNDFSIEIISGFIRLGRKGSIVDNAHAGGIVVSFDKNTGKMRDEGIQLLDNGGGIFYNHPDSGIIFDNFQIPLYKQVQDLVRKAAALYEFPLLGWDIAITPDGPTIIEVNHDFHLFLSDRMEGGLKKNVLFSEILKKV